MGLLTANEKLNPLCPKRLMDLPNQESIPKILYLLVSTRLTTSSSRPTSSTNSRPSTTRDLLLVVVSTGARAPVQGGPTYGEKIYF
jgi:hypothetical protein